MRYLSTVVAAVALSYVAYLFVGVPKIKNEHETFILWQAERCRIEPDALIQILLPVSQKIVIINCGDNQHLNNT